MHPITHFVYVNACFSDLWIFATSLLCRCSLFALLSLIFESKFDPRVQISPTRFFRLVRVNLSLFAEMRVCFKTKTNKPRMLCLQILSLTSRFFARFIRLFAFACIWYYGFRFSFRWVFLIKFLRFIVLNSTCLWKFSRFCTSGLFIVFSLLVVFVSSTLSRFFPVYYLNYIGPSVVLIFLYLFLRFSFFLSFIVWFKPLALSVCVGPCLSIVLLFFHSCTAVQENGVFFLKLTFAFGF